MDKNTGKVGEFYQSGKWEPFGDVDRVPTQTGKPGKMGRHFPAREKSGNFEQSGKVRENHTKYWKNIREFKKNVMLFFSDI